MKNILLAISLLLTSNSAIAAGCADAFEQVATEMYPKTAVGKGIMGVGYTGLGVGITYTAITAGVGGLGLAAVGAGAYFYQAKYDRLMDFSTLIKKSTNGEAFPADNKTVRRLTKRIKQLTQRTDITEAEMADAIVKSEKNSELCKDNEGYSNLKMTIQSFSETLVKQIAHHL
jgi:hypothetical protein